MVYRRERKATMDMGGQAVLYGEEGRAPLFIEPSLLTQEQNATVLDASRRGEC